MTARNPTPPAQAALAIALAAATALAAVWGLGSLTRPPHFDARLAAVRLDATQARGLLGRPLDRGPSASADCVTPVAAAGDKLRRDLAALAANARLNPPHIDVRPSLAADAPPGLTPFDVEFEATGPYDAALAALAAIATLRPTVFIETTDLHAKVSVVTLSLKGRAFCALPH